MLQLNPTFCSNFFQFFSIFFERDITFAISSKCVENGVSGFGMSRVCFAVRRACALRGAVGHTLMLSLSLITDPSSLSATARVSFAPASTMFFVRNCFKSLLILLSTRAVAEARASAVVSNLEKFLSETLRYKT
jgi:hypothetical protein